MSEIQDLQVYEQNMQGLVMQRQKIEQEMIEIDSALIELESTEESYRIIGNIMVKQDPEKIKQELKEKRDVIDIKIKSYVKQENIIKEKSKELQQKVLDKMKKE